MDIPINMDVSISYFKGSILSIKLSFLTTKIVFLYANSADPEEMAYAAFHLDLNCLQKYLFTGV